MTTTTVAARSRATAPARSAQARSAKARARTGLVLSLTFGVALAVGVGAEASVASAASSPALPKAKKALLVKADMPAGWTGQGSVTTSSNSGGSFPGKSQMASCLGVPKSALSVNTPTATSPNFQDPNGTLFVQDQVSVFRSAKVASTQYKLISGKKVPACLTAVFAGPGKSALEGSPGSGVTIGTVTVTPTPAAALVPHSSGFTLSFPVTSNGVTLQSSAQIISMTRGNLGSQVEFTSIGTPMTNAMIKHLVAVAYGRT